MYAPRPGTTTPPLIAALRHQSTWQLFLLGIITLAVYYAHYIKRQSQVINEHAQEGQRINPALVTNIMGLAYVSLAFFFISMFVESALGSGAGPTLALNLVSSLLNLVFSVLMLVWGFSARNRVNSICGFVPGSFDWLQGLWTFLLTPLYFNYKVNTLSDIADSRQA